ncbi:PHD and RING finger domain-containing protein [Scenedesmus sp. PABB004]|nr:PHD and RING finger domain-containing protein [Scenedesmus sp. PABB004]
MAECGICYDRVEEVGELDCCAHEFCWPCITTWADRETRCPFCKSRFTTLSRKAVRARGGGAQEQQRPAKRRRRAGPGGDGGAGSRGDGAAGSDGAGSGDSDGSGDGEGGAAESPRGRVGGAALETRTYRTPRDQVYVPDAASLAFLESLRCAVCGGDEDEEQLLICDGCDQGYHTYCVNCSTVPLDDWFCPDCVAQFVREREAAEAADAARRARARGAGRRTGRQGAAPAAAGRAVPGRARLRRAAAGGGGGAGAAAGEPIDLTLLDSDAEPSDADDDDAAQLLGSQDASEGRSSSSDDAEDGEEDEEEDEEGQLPHSASRSARAPRRGASSAGVGSGGGRRSASRARAAGRNGRAARRGGSAGAAGPPPDPRLRTWQQLRDEEEAGGSASSSQATAGAPAAAGGRAAAAGAAAARDRPAPAAPEGAPGSEEEAWRALELVRQEAAGAAGGGRARSGRAARGAAAAGGAGGSSGGQRRVTSSYFASGAGGSAAQATAAAPPSSAAAPSEREAQLRAALLARLQRQRDLAASRVEPADPAEPGWMDSIRDGVTAARERGEEQRRRASLARAGSGAAGSARGGGSAGAAAAAAPPSRLELGVAAALRRQQVPEGWRAGSSSLLGRWLSNASGSAAGITRTSSSGPAAGGGQGGRQELRSLPRSVRTLGAVRRGVAAAAAAGVNGSGQPSQQQRLQPSQQQERGRHDAARAGGTSSRFFGPAAPAPPPDREQLGQPQSWQQRLMMAQLRPAPGLPGEAPQQQQTAAQQQTVAQQLPALQQQLPALQQLPASQQQLAAQAQPQGSLGRAWQGVAPGAAQQLASGFAPGGLPPWLPQPQLLPAGPSCGGGPGPPGVWQHFPGASAGSAASSATGLAAAAAGGEAAGAVQGQPAQWDPTPHSAPPPLQQQWPGAATAGASAGAPEQQQQAQQVAFAAPSSPPLPAARPPALSADALKQAKLAAHSAAKARLAPLLEARRVGREQYSEALRAATRALYERAKRGQLGLDALLAAANGGAGGGCAAVRDVLDGVLAGAGVAAGAPPPAMALAALSHTRHTALTSSAGARRRNARLAPPRIALDADAGLPLVDAVYVIMAWATAANLANASGNLHIATWTDAKSTARAFISNNIWRAPIAACTLGGLMVVLFNLTSCFVLIRKSMTKAGPGFGYGFTVAWAFVMSFFCLLAALVMQGFSSTVDAQLTAAAGWTAVMTGAFRATYVLGYIVAVGFMLFTLILLVFQGAVTRELGIYEQMQQQKRLLEMNAMAGAAMNPLQAGPI